MRIRQLLAQALDEIGQSTVEDLRSNLQREKGATDAEQTLEFNVNGLQLIVQGADYLNYIDSGRQPGSFPPVQAIKGFIERKGITPTDRGLGEPTIDQLAYLIGRSIERNGIPPANILGIDEDFIEEKIEQASEEGIIVELDERILK